MSSLERIVELGKLINQGTGIVSISNYKHAFLTKLGQSKDG